MSIVGTSVRILVQPAGGHESPPAAARERAGRASVGRRTSRASGVGRGASRRCAGIRRAGPRPGVPVRAADRSGPGFLHRAAVFGSRPRWLLAGRRAGKSAGTSTRITPVSRPRANGSATRPAAGFASAFSIPATIRRHDTIPLHLRADLGRNFVDGDPNDATDPGRHFPLNQPGHGTATAALLAGRKVAVARHGFNDFLGGAPHAEVVPIRIADSVVHFRTSSMADGIHYAVDQACDVVSISMGGVPTRAWAAAVNRAYEAGVAIFAAAGKSIRPVAAIVDRLSRAVPPRRRGLRRLFRWLALLPARAAQKDAGLLRPGVEDADRARGLHAQHAVGRDGLRTASRLRRGNVVGDTAGGGRGRAMVAGRRRSPPGPSHGGRSRPCGVRCSRVPGRTCRIARSTSARDCYVRGAALDVPFAGDLVEDAGRFGFVPVAEVGRHTRSAAAGADRARS